MVDRFPFRRPRRRSGGRAGILAGSQQGLRKRVGECSDPQRFLAKSEELWPEVGRQCWNFIIVLVCFRAVPEALG
jgi:hypothetical protein